MSGKIRLLIGVSIALLLTAGAMAGYSQAKPAGKAVMWEPVDIPSRNLLVGPAAGTIEPVLEGMQYIGPQGGGNSIKYRLKDSKGQMWIAKVADESQAEVAATRLMWGIGYPTEINFIVPRLTMPIEPKIFGNVRLEARPEKVKREGNWKWEDNPFAGTNELAGMKILMAMFNNWDLKESNNVILKEDDTLYYTISDLGASFGRLAKSNDTRSGRSVNEPEHFAASPFLTGVQDGRLQFAYKGAMAHLMDGITVEQGRWLADLLVQLSDKQIVDAFKAANHSDDDAALFAAAFRARIDELDRATKPAAAAAVK